MRKTPSLAFHLTKLGDYEALRPYVIAQSKHETNNYRSNVFDKYNNLFGMKNASFRMQYGKNVDSTDYRVYVSSAQSIKDLLLYFDYVGFPKSVQSVDQYVQELKHRDYFEDDFFNYRNGLLRFL